MKPITDYVKHALTVLLLVSTGSVDGKGLEDERRLPDEMLQLQRPESAYGEQSRFAEQFNTTDGSHIVLTQYLLKRLRMPESYVHVRTNYERKGERLHVQTVYRAKNAKGMYCTQRITAVASLDGALFGVSFA
ncbi:hypothetical protein WCX18_01115 [Sulfurimonas sp. HSL1-2]|uniref:hypothetical protein n=1 Tax=Thiomicrolovo zhangzhouensis TaxID=3131933 RepID=UPI0031F7F6DF